MRRNECKEEDCIKRMMRRRKRNSFWS